MDVWLARHGATHVAFTPYCDSYFVAGRAFPQTTPTDWYLRGLNRLS